MVVSDACSTAITVQSTSAQSTTQWRHWVAWQRGGTMYRLSSAAGPALLVPRRVFASPAQEQEFVALLQRHVGVEEADPAIAAG
jgi:hypothetical protein